MSRTSSEFDVTAVVSALNRECNNTVEEVDKAITEAGRAALDYLLENSPVDTSKSAKLHISGGKLKGSSGLYRKGWRIKTYTENGVKAVKVYNETCYQLTHLLRKTGSLSSLFRISSRLRSLRKEFWRINCNDVTGGLLAFAFIGLSRGIQGLHGGS